MRERMQIDLKDAMRARDRERAEILRVALAAIANAEAVDPADHPGATEVPRRLVDDAETLDIVRHHHDELRSAGAHAERGGRPDDAARLRRQAEVLAAYLA